MAKDIILTLKNITKEFPGVKALDDVTINVERGTIHGLVGENGAGKSTLIKVLAGIYRPNHGEVILEGKTLREVASFVSDKLSTLDTVLSTATHFILRKYKDHGTVFGQKKEDEREMITP
jgi:ABC-type branched-subunit amino acid transport system ATPase component